MKLIVGLGNPGSKYEKTRHNIGFVVADVLQKRLKLGDFRNESKFKAEVARGEFNKEKIVIIKPQTFMNLSGEAVQMVKQFYKIDSKNIWMAFDDVDLPLGMLRIRPEGSAGSHNGVKSVLQTLATERIVRFRLGVESRGALTPVQQDLSSFVLEPFRNEELPEVNKMVKNCVEAMVLTLKKGVEAAQNEFSG